MLCGLFGVAVKAVCAQSRYVYALAYGSSQMHVYRRSATDGPGMLVIDLYVVPCRVLNLRRCVALRLQAS
jgi:hypothetical protein